MVFSSLEFIFAFLPVFLLLYFITPKRFKNVTLLLGSIYFYAFGEPVYVVLILCSIVVNYLMSTWIKGKYAGLFLTAALFLDVGTLLVFKYANFITENVNRIYDLDLPPVNLTLPIGISFYTFQMISYLVDVYRGKIKTKQTLICFATYICMFPQLIAGPIVIYGDIEESMHNRKTTPEQMEQGIKLFILGLASKVLVADKIGLLWHEVQTIGFESISTPLAWMGALAFSLQIYFDFNGYSLMAVGLGNLLGFSLPFNFRQPYMSSSLSEFWQRWHITLGRWFREYVYIPLGGSRCSRAKMIRNLFIVWMLTGFWHGSEWNFVLWGLVTCFWICMEKLFLKKWLDKNRIVSGLYMLALLPVTWIMFAVTDLADLGRYLQRMFPFVSGQFIIYGNPGDWVKYLSSFGWLFALGAVCVTSLPALLYRKTNQKTAAIPVFVALFWLSVYALANAVYNPFLYFRF